jgi:PD-(D/E)XK endonuclease
MKRWGKFSTLKERGEWVELQFMAAAASRGYHVLKPCGDSLAYDVGIEHGGHLLRVQVKSTGVRNGMGYFCQFRRNYLTKHPYTVDEVDLFAAYIIPVSTWYLIPAAVILKPTVKVAVTLYPVTALKKNRYRYEHYREAWGLLEKTRRDLSRTAKSR